MQHKHIALAAMALIAGVQAQAATLISGASASSIAYVEALSTNNVCPSNNVSVFVRGTATNALGNNFTVKCNGGTFGTTGENEVRFDVNGGSLNAILFSTAGTSEVLAGNAGGLSAATTGCTATNPTGVMTSFLGTTGNKLNLCASNAALTSGKSVGGFMDIEPQIFQAQGVITGDYSANIQPATFSQAFAVGVSSALYNALQAYQQTAAGGNLVPSTCAAGDATAACQPTIGRAQVNAIINSNEFNDAKNKGAKFLVPTTTETNLTYCRRPATSGTQMGAEVYFLQAVLGTGALSGFGSIHEPSYLTGSAPVGAATVVNGGSVLIDNTAAGVGATGTLTVLLNSGTGDLKKCLNKQAVGTPAQPVPAGTFAIGILSAENNPIGSSDTYKLVKLNGASTTAGVAGDSQTANAIKGIYDYVFESVVFDAGSSTVGTKVLNLINTGVKTGAGTPGVFLNVNSTTPESNFTRNGSSVNAYSSN